MKKYVALASLAAVSFATSSALAETRVSFASGVDYSSGDYGETVDTEVVSVPLVGRVITENWSFRVSVPYLSITGPADVADTSEGGGDGGDTGGGDGAIVRTGTERGIGDTTVSATRSFRRLGGSRAYLDVSGRVRFPTGDEEKGLGVGTTDYTLSGELGTSGEPGGVWVSAGRRFLGDRTGVDRQDGWQASLGGWLRAGEQTRVGASYWWRDASIDGNEEPSGVSAYVSYRMSDSLRLSVTGGAGLSDATADYTAGVRLTWRSDAME
jgi:hypothetical protein